ncbi:hypothetical protein GQ457_09G018450 [Hibiscus cannabinus]
MRIVLKQERKEYVIEEAVSNDPGPNAPRADKDKFKKHMDDVELGFDNLLELDDKGDVSTRDNGSGLGRFSRLIQISAERLVDKSNLNFIEKSITKNNFSLYYNRANLPLVEDLEHIGWW